MFTSGMTNDGNDFAELLFGHSCSSLTSPFLCQRLQASAEPTVLVAYRENFGIDLDV